MAYPSRLVGRHTNTIPAPMNQLNITPLIDVLLVLLVMLILSIPIATHKLDVDRPGPCAGCETTDYDSVALVVQTDGTVLWNDEAVTSDQLRARLASAAAQPTNPLIRFQPEANAGYEDSVNVINAVADAGGDKFAFAGNEQYRSFDAD